MGRKHFGKEEKLRVTSNFSFSHSDFKRCVLQTHKNQGLFGKGLTLSQWQILDSSKMKELADNNFKLDENGNKLS